MKRIVCIFAHPDDEAFALGGSIAKLAKDHEVYILCATKGEAGQNSLEATEELAHIREHELRESANVLGVKEVYFLGFKDGTLSNDKYHLLADKIQEKLDVLTPDTLITMDFTGNSGHIDHIMVSYVTMYVFKKNPTIKTLMQYCTKEAYAKQMKDYFIYFPKGYNRSEVDEIIDTSAVWETKLKAMYCHKSQMHDVERILTMQKTLPKEDYFLVFEK